MYRKVLVPMDGSAHSRFTLVQAVALASEFSPGVTLTVLHVGSLVAFAEGGMVMDLSSLMEEEGKAILATAEEAFVGTNLGHDTQYLVGDPAETICRFADEGHYDLVVIGNRGRGLFTELLLGSVSHKVIQHAPCPVLVIRETRRAERKNPAEAGF